MLSDDGVPQALGDNSLDFQGINLDQDVVAEAITPQRFRPQFIFACVISLFVHGVVVCAIAYWWMQGSQQSFSQFAPSFQLSINSPPAESKPSNLDSINTVKETPTLSDKTTAIKAASVVPLPKSASPQSPQKVAEDVSQETPVSVAEDSALEVENVSAHEDASAAIEVVANNVEEKQEAKQEVKQEVKQEALPELNKVESNPSLVQSTAKPKSGSLLLGIDLSPNVEKIGASERKVITDRIKKYIQNNKSSALDNAVIEWEEQGSRYHAKFTRQALSDAMALEPMHISLRRIRNGEERFTDIHYKRLAFSNYAQIVNRWDENVMISKDIFEGRFHSNTSIRIEPGKKLESIFLGDVTIATFRDPPKKRANRKFFEEQLELGAEKIVLPKGVSPLNGELPPNEAQLHYFNEDTTIRFLSDGQYEWSTATQGVWQDKRAIHQEASYLLAEKGVRLSVLGQVAGKVIVYSPERITVVGNIVYANDPRVDPNSGDYLGLVSEKNVEVAGPKIIGDRDLDIHGAIYAKRRFVVRRYRARTNAKMTILGSVSAGSLSATEPRYATQVLFDQRLENNRPPLFPVTEQYELNDWNERWQQEP